MTSAHDHPPAEKHRYLWLMAAAPAVWAAHFLVSYVTAAVWCARFVPRDGATGPVHVAIGWYTLVALAAIAIVGFGGYRRHGRGFEASEHDMDTPGDRHRFLGFATLLLAGLSAIATIYVAISAVFMERCY